MGYYTDYDLSAYYYKNDPCCSQTVTGDLHGDLLDAVRKEIDLMNVFDDNYNGTNWYTNAKWYDYEEDMCLLSSKFPDVMFELSGHGENQQDMWTSYFYQGKTQYCPAIITYDDLDLKKMTAKTYPQTYCYQS